MELPATAALQALHSAVVSAQGVAPEREMAMLDRFRELLETAELPRSHTYWNHFYYYRIRLLYGERRLHEALALAEEAVRHDPHYAGVWQLKGAVEYDLGRCADAFHSLKTAWRLSRDYKHVPARLVSILFRRKRYRPASKLGRRVLAEGDTDPSFRLLMAQVELGAHNAELALSHLDAYERAAPATDHTRYVRRLAESLAAHQLRHVAIAGMSYVGSTLLGTLLGSLPGCAHAGETQELIHRRNPQAYEFPIIDFAHDPDEAIPHCRICGAQCPVFTREFRAELVRDPADWYFRIGRRLGARTVISSDKFLSEYLAKDPLFRFDLIVLYKPLESWAWSFRREEARKAANGAPTSPTAGDLERTLDQWAANYYGFLKDLRPQGRRLVIDWERFAERPREHFDLLVTKLGLAGDLGVFDQVRASHYVGGNDGIVPVLREGRVSFRPSRAGALSREDEVTVRGHRAAQSVLRLLESCYRSDFREVAGLRE